MYIHVRHSTSSAPPWHGEVPYAKFPLRAISPTIRPWESPQFLSLYGLLPGHVRPWDVKPLARKRHPLEIQVIPRPAITASLVVAGSFINLHDLDLHRSCNKNAFDVLDLHQASTVFPRVRSKLHTHQEHVAYPIRAPSRLFTPSKHSILRPNFSSATAAPSDN